MCTSSSLISLYQEITGLSRVCHTTELWRDQRSGSNRWRPEAAKQTHVSPRPSPITSVRIVTQTETDTEKGSIMYNIIYTPQQSCIWSWKSVLRGDFFSLGYPYNQGIRGGKGVVGSWYFGEESHFLLNTKLKWPQNSRGAASSASVWNVLQNAYTQEQYGTENVLQSTAHCTGLPGEGVYWQYLVYCRADWWESNYSNYNQ